MKTIMKKTKYNFRSQKIKEIIIFIFLILSTIINNIFIMFKYNNDFIEIEKYTKNNMKGYIRFSRLKYRKINTPKISIVITVFNGEGYIRPVLCSIQNQNFLDLEIIIVDDFSKDNSVKLIKEIMKEEPRIILLENHENKGTLYSKSRGVLHAKGKYVISLDHDNLYSSKYAFSLLYKEAEKNNLDLLGFSSIVSSIENQHLKVDKYINYVETPIIKSPFIQKRFFKDKFRSCTFLCLYLIKTELYKKVLKILGKEILNRNIDSHDDTIIIFLLTKYANKLKHIKRILHLIFVWPIHKSQVLIFQYKNKMKLREKKKCKSILTLIEVLFLFTENNIEDKNIACIDFVDYFIKDNECNKSRDQNLIKEILRISTLFLNNEFVDIKYKNIINNFLREIKNNIFLI